MPDSATVDAGDSVTLRVLENDEDDGLPEGSTLTVVGVGKAGGRLTFTADEVTFTSGPGDQGDYLMKYDVSDGELVSKGDITVTVRPKVDPTVSIGLAKSPVALRRYRIHGSVRPEATAKGARVTVQRRTAQGWEHYARTASDAEGRWAVPFRTDRLGSYTFRAEARPVGGGRTVSKTLSRRVGARPDVRVSGPLQSKDVRHSWRSGCPVPPSDLRKVTINRYDYRKRISRGSLVVRADAVKAMVRTFSGALSKRFPVKMMKPTDAFYWGGRRTPTESDKAAMRAGNTSAFNCRPVVGNPYRLSQHSYGNAIDIDTVENPYVTGSHVYPSGSRRYLDRSPYRRGMILKKGVIASRMRSNGWLWGARWAHPDYQHFSSNGG